MSDVQDVYVVGIGGFGREICAMAKFCQDVNIVGVYADGDPDLGLIQNWMPWLGPLANLTSGQHFVVGIGNSSDRKRVATALMLAGAVSARPIVHPTVAIGHDVRLGDGTIVCSHSSLTTNIRVGAHVHVNLGCTIGHDAVLDDYVTLSPGSHVSGKVHICEGVEMGTGSVILPDLTVGEYAKIGAGAVVNRDVAPGVTVVGVPARELVT